MTRRKAMSERPWSVPVALREVPETGRHVELAADERARAAIAKLVGLRTLPRLHAVFDVTLGGRDGLRVVGRVSATIGQTCVVTLEPIENEIEEEIDLVFAPAAAPSPEHFPAKWEPDRRRNKTKRAGALSDSSGTESAPIDQRGEKVEIGPVDAPEPLVGGVVDLGALATEYLMLGIDPYPRKPGAVFEGAAVGDSPTNPFAALAALKKKQGGTEG